MFRSSTIRLVQRLPKTERAVPSEATFSEQEASTETYNRRRRILWTAGVTIIAGAGAILGAQLKTTRQEHRKHENLIAQAQATIDSALENPPSPAETTKDKISEPKQIKTPDVAHQIALLENRRSELMRQKIGIEQKIQHLHERKRRNEGIEAKRREMQIRR